MEEAENEEGEEWRGEAVDTISSSRPLFSLVCGSGALFQKETHLTT